MKCTPKIAAFPKIFQKIFETKKAACSGYETDDKSTF